VSIDLEKVVERVRELLTRPRSTWPVIAGEAETPETLYRNFIAVLAAIPPLAAFIKGSLLGYGTEVGVSVRIALFPGLVAMVVGYLLSLVAVFGFALVIEAVAPNFDGRRDRMMSLKLAGYSSAAAFVGGAAVVLPGIGGLLYLAAIGYSFYLLYLGVQVLLAVPAAKALPLTVICAAAAVVLHITVARIAAGFTGALLPLGGYGLL
jgi:hypothetical protein